MTASPRARSELVSDWRLLAFGTLASMASAPGQTLIISLFNADIRAEFNLSHSEFGMIYMIATLASAAVILWSGKLIDSLDLRTMFALTSVGLAVACVLAGFSAGALGLLLAMFLLRHFGQGLMSHIAITSVNRYYENVRGKASAFVGFGFNAAEAIMPISIATLILAIGWRASWFVLAAAVVLVILPLLLWLISDHRQRHGRYLDRLAILTEARGRPDHFGQRQFTRGQMLRDPVFYGVLPVVVLSPFFGTGLMFHHQHFVFAKGWPLEQWYLSLFLYALVAALAGLAAGALGDRVGARRMMPLVGLPLGLGSLVLALAADAGWIPLVLVLFGATTGMAGTVTSPFWAEQYGVQHLGAIKSLATSVTILASALSPAVYGLAFDAGLGVLHVALGGVVFALLASLVAWLSLRGRA